MKIFQILATIAAIIAVAGAQKTKQACGATCSTPCDGDASSCCC
ncbi:hypothetical protein Ocin01_15953 [Orchesella cincta]|uniref:Uncharacterized protein n=1 Tax=Orchesella cincta TaxID=48709 RepID=A0A1D2MCQ8_ORCCI|nr:hypothetical protein Ocin01_15953 [Orchesella cincta]